MITSDNLYGLKAQLVYFGFWLTAFLLVSSDARKMVDTHSLSDIQFSTLLQRISKNKSIDDVHFMVKVAEINMLEMQLGQLAQQKAVTPDVKDLGRRIEAKHIEYYGQLKTLAKQKLITIPVVNTKYVESAYDQFNARSTGNFDKAYCNRISSEMERAITLFQKASSQVIDPEIRKWANTTLPELKSQLGYAVMAKKNIK